MSLEIRLRPAAPADRRFLLDVYASTRAAELALTDWDEARKRAFIEMQFDAQDTHYRTNYLDTSYDVVVVDGQPAGRLYVGRWADEIRIVDITVLPELQRKGVGTLLLRRLTHEADVAAKPLTIHVERANPARRLYERLGFAITRELEVHLLMTRQPNTAS